MKAISKTILFTMFAAASSFAMAEQNSDQVIQRHKEAKPVLKALLEEGVWVKVKSRPLIYAAADHSTSTPRTDTP